jgi:hypothetical protein
MRAAFLYQNESSHAEDYMTMSTSSKRGAASWVLGIENYKIERVGAAAAAAAVSDTAIVTISAAQLIFRTVSNFIGKLAPKRLKVYDS